MDYSAAITQLWGHFRKSRYNMLRTYTTSSNVIIHCLCAYTTSNKLEKLLN